RGGAEKEEAADALRVSEGEGEREEAAHRRADEVDPAGAEAVGEVVEPLRSRLPEVAAAIVDGGGEAAPRPIGDDDMARQAAGDERPVARLGHAAMHQHGRVFA